jgi:hypothetical protein
MVRCCGMDYGVGFEGVCESCGRWLTGGNKTQFNSAKSKGEKG